MAQEIFLYHSGMSGAPSTTVVTAGGLVGLLSACLVDGFNTNSVTSMTRTGSVVTVTTSAAHNRGIGQQVNISGAGEAGYNDTWWITGVPTTTTLTFDIGAATPTTPATGTISAKTPSAGWTKPYTGTNSAVFTPGAGGTGISMQVEDNNPYADANVGARTRMVAAASGIPDSGDILAEQCRIAKVNGAWMLVADKRTVYLFMAATNTFAFGDLRTFLSGDIYHSFQNRGKNTTALCYWAGSNVTGIAGTSFPGFVAAENIGAGSIPMIVFRDTTQLITSQAASPVLSLSRAFPTADPTASAAPVQYNLSPNPSDNSVCLVPVPIVAYQAGGGDIRGMLRGVYWPLGVLPVGSFNAQYFLILNDVIIGGELKKIVTFRFGYNAGQQLAIDLGASWA